MSTLGRRLLVVPGTDAYESLSWYDKFDCASEAVQAEAESRHCRPDWLSFFKGKMEFARATIVFGLKDLEWDMRHDFFIEGRIEGKLGRHPILLKPYESQEGVFAHVYGKLRAGKQVRVIYLGGRRSAKTVTGAAVCYPYIAHYPGRKGILVAHKDDSLRDIFDEKYAYALKQDPLRPATRIENKYELIFDEQHSMLRAVNGNSTSEGVGHGLWWDAIHVTEAGHLEPESSHRLMSGLLIAQENNPSDPAIAFVETRGGYPEGWAPDKVHAELKEPGSSGFDLIFNLCFNRHDAKIPFDSESSKLKFSESMTEDEIRVKARFGLSLESINWWRTTYRSIYLSRADLSEQEAQAEWKRDNPFSPDEAFQSEGTSVFPSGLVAEAAKIAADTPPPWEGHIFLPGPRFEHGFKRVWKTAQPELKKALGGQLVIWEHPQEGCSYCFGADPAISEGVDADPSAIYGICRTCRTKAFRIRAKLDPERDFFDIIRAVSVHWNDALINPETNFRPEMVRWLAETDRQRFLHIRRDPSKTERTRGVEDDYGNLMTQITKRQAIHILQKTLKTEPALLSDKMLLAELPHVTLKWSRSADGPLPKYVIGRSGGSHGDVALSASMALWADAEAVLPVRRPAPKPVLEETSIHAQWLASVKEMQKNRDDVGHDDDSWRLMSLEEG